MLKAAFPVYVQPGVLSIHQISIQQGEVVGSDGATPLIDAGNRTRGSTQAVPYLARIRIHLGDGLDFMDADHLGSLDEVIQAG